MTLKKFKTLGAMGGSALAAITSSLCCIGPLVAGMLGAGAFGAGAVFEKWRPLFLLLTFALLARAWYVTYWKPGTACEQGASCQNGGASSKWNKAALWVVTGFVFIAAAFPAISSAFFGGRGATCCAGVTATDGNNGKHREDQTRVEPSILEEIHEK